MCKNSYSRAGGDAVQVTEGFSGSRIQEEVEELEEGSNTDSSPLLQLASSWNPLDFNEALCRAQRPPFESSSRSRTQGRSREEVLGRQISHPKNRANASPLYRSKPFPGYQFKWWVIKGDKLAPFSLKTFLAHLPDISPGPVCLTLYSVMTTQKSQDGHPYSLWLDLVS